MTTMKTRANTDVNVLHSHEHCVDFDQKTPIELDNHDTVTIRLKNFHPNASFQIEKVKFFRNKKSNGSDEKDGNQPAGVWTRTGGADPNLKAYTVTENGPAEVVIERVETTPTEKRYWYGLEITNNSNVIISLDPELINKPG